MAIRELRYLGDAVLRQKTNPVERFDDELGTLLDDLLETIPFRVCVYGNPDLMPVGLVCSCHWNTLRMVTNDEALSGRRHPWRANGHRGVRGTDRS